MDSFRKKTTRYIQSIIYLLLNRTQGTGKKNTNTDTKKNKK